MQTPENLLTGIKTRGDFRALNAHASQESRLLPDSEMPPEHPIWDVWNQIKSAYPGPCSNWEVSPPMIWAYAIEGLTPDQLANGVRNLARRAEEFPPNAGQFRDLCLTDFDWEHKRLKYVPPIGIEDQTAKAKRTTEGLDAIRALREATGL